MLGNFQKTLAGDDAGAVTVEWVVVSAVAVCLALVVLTTLGGSAHDYADRIGRDSGSQGVQAF